VANSGSDWVGIGLGAGLLAGLGVALCAVAPAAPAPGLTPAACVAYGLQVERTARPATPVERLCVEEAP